MTLTDLIVAARLTFSHARHQPVRMVLTTLSAAAAAAIVVAVVSSYDSLLGKFSEVAGGYLGRYDLVVLPVPQNKADPQPQLPPPLPPSLVEALRTDPGVAAVDPVFQSRVTVTKGNGNDRPRTGRPTSPQGATESPDPAGLPPGLPRSPTLVGTSAADPPYPIIAGRWLGPAGPNCIETVLSRDVADDLGVQAGDTVMISRGRGAGRVVPIVGVIEQRKRPPQAGVIIGLPSSKPPPLARGPAVTAIYVRSDLAAAITEVPFRADFIGVVLKPGVSPDDFTARWTTTFAASTPQAEAHALADVSSDLSNSSTADSVRGQALSATGISLLAALFIIMTTLSMGVDERVRQFAVLRAVALTKFQVASMIVMEGLLLGLIGWVIGLLSGWVVLTMVSRFQPDLFPVGSSLGYWCIVLSAGCAIGGALVASIVPAWRATRVGPLDAMAPAPQRNSTRLSTLMAALGLILVAINPLVVFYIPMPDTARYLVFAAVGCTSLAVGFALLAPAAIVWMERLCGPLLARLLGLHPVFLATHLTSNLWRTLGTTMALTVGLGLFVTVQVWGYSMLEPFVPGDWVPDLLVAVQPAGVPDERLSAVGQVPGIAAGRCLPVAAEQVNFADDVTGSAVRTSASRQNNCVMVGVDPAVGIGGDHPLFRFRFIEGTRDEAAAKLSNGRFCLVPDHFARDSGLGVGGKFRVIPPTSPKAAVEYEIAGVVSMDGWHWMSKVGFRNRGGGRSAGLMFAAFNQVRQDFGKTPIKIFWMDTDGSATTEEIEASFQKLAGSTAVPPSRPRGSRSPHTQTPYAPKVTLRSVRDVRQEIRDRADGIIRLLSQMPLLTLAVTSFGVANAVLSSVRARRWELGIFRAMGVTRWGLFRIVLAEGILVGAVACVLSLGLGITAGYCGTGVSRYVSVRGGLITPLVIPWLRIAIGFGATLALCLAAALWPAFQAGRAEPLRLLQSGRTAA